MPLLPAKQLTGILATAGSTGVTLENAGTSTLAARSDHVHALLKQLDLFVAGTLAVGDAQQVFHIEVPANGWVLTEVAARVKTAAGTELGINLREFTDLNVDNGDILTTDLLFGAGAAASTTGIVSARTTPGKGYYYKLDINTVTGSAPADLAVELKFKVLTDSLGL